MGGGKGRHCVRNVYPSVCYPRIEIILTVIFIVFLCGCETESLSKYVPYNSKLRAAIVDETELRSITSTTAASSSIG